MAAWPARTRRGPPRRIFYGPSSQQDPREKSPDATHPRARKSSMRLRTGPGSDKPFEAAPPALVFRNDGDGQRHAGRVREGDLRPAQRRRRRLSEGRGRGAPLEKRDRRGEVPLPPRRRQGGGRGPPQPPPPPPP